MFECCSKSIQIKILSLYQISSKSVQVFRCKVIFHYVNLYLAYKTICRSMFIVIEANTNV